MKKSKKRGGRKPGSWTLVTPMQIREYRQTYRLSRLTMAGLLGVSSTTVVNWETGNGVATTAAQRRIQELLRRPPAGTVTGAPTQVSGNGKDSPETMEAVGKILAAYLQSAKVKPEGMGDLVLRVRAALG